MEPSRATGHTAVSLKVNSQNLDYENANERKFLLLVEAKEPAGKLSSTATVTVEVLDLNDNAPQFPKNSYTAIVSEAAPEGFEVITITAEDRDSRDFGTQGIKYQLTGQGAELFKINPLTGVITVASCIENCLDYESIRAYYLSVTATDNLGEGKKTVVNLRISVADANDNSPKFLQRSYKASIDEGESKFEPRLYLKAEDQDESSILRFNIIDGNTNNLFALNRFVMPLCGNFRIFLSLRFYVKSSFGDSRSSKTAILGALNCVNLVNFSLQKVQKCMKIRICSRKKCSNGRFCTSRISKT